MNLLNSKIFLISIILFITAIGIIAFFDKTLAVGIILIGFLTLITFLVLSKAKIKSKTLSLEDVKKILDSIIFAKHSCIDMGWRFRASELEGRFIIQTSFQRKDINSGELGTGWGRENVTPVEEATEMSIVMTAWMAIETVVKHELMEGFEYKGVKLLNPHKSINELAYPEILK